MKKYIKPKTRFINLHEEGELLTSSFIEKKEGGSDNFNQGDGYTLEADPIWGQ